MPASGPAARNDLHALAAEKLTRVFGTKRGQELLDSVLAAVHITRIETPDDLLAVAAGLKARGGFEAATGALLEVQATMRRT